MFDLQEALGEVSEKLDAVMHDVLPGKRRLSNKVISISGQAEEDLDDETENTGETKVMEAMRYSALSGGKRLRPFLTVECAGLFGVMPDDAMHTAAAIECVHTYSLIHDDLPAMDNDDMRRGKPSCHKQFGEAAAILAGDGLLTFAFQLLADPMVHSDPSVRCQLITALTKASGVHGMVGGQMMDLDAEEQALDMDEIIRLQRLKTGEMFAVSCEAGGILGKATEQQLRKLSRYAHDMGLAFQITDDLLDVEGTREETGKEVGKDHAAGKATLVGIMGVETAREQAETLAQQAIAHLNGFGTKANNLRSLAEYVVNRRG